MDDKIRALKRDNEFDLFEIVSEIDCLTICDYNRQGIAVERSHDEQKGSINRPDDRRVGHDGA